MEREVSFITAKERKGEEQMRRMKDKYEGEKEEATRQIASLQHRETQAQHEVLSLSFFIMIIIYDLLFVICYLLFVICYLLIISCLLLVVY